MVRTVSQSGGSGLGLGLRQHPSHRVSHRERLGADAPVVVNVAERWSSTLNEMVDIFDRFHASTRPLQQEVISLPAPRG
jgi:hypothetical protein